MAKKLLLLAALFALTFAVVAQDEESPLRDDHPQEYVVQKGDTLWDISSRFLRSPWLWPEIWHANPQIDNPHLIYPGDRISLVYVDGEPRLSLERGERPTVKLSPRVRRSDHPEAINTIPLSAIRPYLRDARVLSEDEIEGLPYVVTNQERRILASAGDVTYARRLDAERGTRVIVARPGHVYREVQTDPPTTEVGQWKVGGGTTVSGEFEKLFDKVAFWEEESRVLGYEVLTVGEGEVIAAGDPATVRLATSSREIRAGDVVMVAEGTTYDARFMPKAAPEDINAHVIALSDAFYGAGQYQVVALNRGASDGVAVGHVFKAYRPGVTIRDEIAHPPEDLDTLFHPDEAKVTLPETYAGEMMVFRTFDHVSYALVLEAQEPVKIYDRAAAP